MSSAVHKIGTLMESARAACRGDGALETGYETEDYALVYGFLTDEDEKRGFLVYLVVNRQFGVVEYRSSALPEAIGVMQNLQAGMREVRCPTGSTPS